MRPFDNVTPVHAGVIGGTAYAVTPFAETAQEELIYARLIKLAPRMYRLIKDMRRPDPRVEVIAHLKQEMSDVIALMEGY